MFVQPTSTLYLISGVKINDYKNQRMFDTPGEQWVYFTSHAMSQIPDNGEKRYSYIRQGMIVVPYPSDELWPCTHLAYQNSSFGDKWFYAFVRKVEYLNSEASTVYFEIDEFQTWMFELEWNPSYTLREHVLDDIIGSHTLDEGLSVGEYVTEFEKAYNFTECWICVVTSVDLNSDSFPNVGGELLDGVYSGLAIYTYDNVSTLNSVLSDLAQAGKSDAISGMYMLPKRFAPTQTNGAKLRGTNYQMITFPVNLPETINGYRPKNAKTLCYPYRAIVATSTSGSASVLRPELFPQSVAPTFRIVASIAAGGSAIIYPLYYKGLPENPYEGAATGSYPQCQWAKDNYLNFIASQDIRSAYAGNQIAIEYNSAQQVAGVNYELAQSTNAAQSVSNAATGFMGGVSSGLINSAAQVASYASNTYIHGEQYDSNKQLNAINYNTKFDSLRNSLAGDREVHALVPPTANGVLGSSPLLVANQYKFGVLVKCVRKDYAKAIDDFFTMYGYRVNELKIPELKSRRFWNFVKVAEANLTGNLPKDSIQVIKTMFESGVTLWHTDDILDYSKDNSRFTPADSVNLTVERGTGSGAYPVNSIVGIFADNIPGQTFQTWRIVSGNPVIADLLRANTSATLVDDCVISAVYGDIPPSYYGVTVSNGTGGGSYAPGTSVKVTANNIPQTQFLKWIATGLPNPEYPINPLTFTMPSNNVSLVAQYRNPVPPLYDTMADIMEAMDGAVEWDATVGMIQSWYYGSYVKDAWCATSASYCAYKAGVQSQVPKNENATTFMLACKPRSNFWYTANYGGVNRLPVRGDCIGFSPNYDRNNIRHVGIVTSVSGNNISYISGNTSNPTSGKPDGIFIKTRAITDLYVVCFFHVVYS